MRDRRERVVVGDRPEALRVGDDPVRGVGEVDEEVLVDLVEEVAVDLDADLLRGLARREGDGAVPVW